MALKGKYILYLLKKINSAEQALSDIKTKFELHDQLYTNELRVMRAENAQLKRIALEAKAECAQAVVDRESAKWHAEAYEKALLSVMEEIEQIPIGEANELDLMGL